MVFSPHERELIDSIISRFSGLSQVSEIIVFGSRARGHSGEDSDLDVLVLISGRDPSLLRQIGSLKELALPDIEDFFYVNVIPLVEADYRKDTGLFRANVERDGVTVWRKR